MHKYYYGCEIRKAKLISFHGYESSRLRWTTKSSNWSENHTCNEQHEYCYKQGC